MRTDALISDCGKYRYWLSRWWSNTIAPATFVMLNPSTADAAVDDPTIRRCIGYAKAWGCGGVRVVNLYAYRATDPKELWKVPDPVGPENDHFLEIFAWEARAWPGPLVAAWGANAKPDRVADVLRIPGMDRLEALALTRQGQPRHPLYLRADLTPGPLWPAVAVSRKGTAVAADICEGAWCLTHHRCLTEHDQIAGVCVIACGWHPRHQREGDRRD